MTEKNTSIFLKEATVIPGRGRGKRLGIPTINIELSHLPSDLTHGIYGCWITISGKRYKGAMHYGPRPVFKDTETLEVHIIDETLTHEPVTVDIEVVGRIRDVLDFPDVEALKQAIVNDIDAVRAMLSA